MPRGTLPWHFRCSTSATSPRSVPRSTFFRRLVSFGGSMVIFIVFSPGFSVRWVDFVFKMNMFLFFQNGTTFFAAFCSRSSAVLLTLLSGIAIVMSPFVSRRLLVLAHEQTSAEQVFEACGLPSTRIVCLDSIAGCFTRHGERIVSNKANLI